ncbi:MAG: ATP-binding cassette domain-containing protein [Aquabacterium sp.]|jgi:ATP-binding cassette subfamily F protein 3|uniref:ABC-F family ATP-binding cassette domain-containing protein n=1 Tax=Aquabacterium sp. TaxID=1872578 RepID=UPI002A358FF2|nr:ATP-binding cassette domain-containing protein [Aquabacterium sp.]MDX9842164.1 ATP-binding cassette domain-containing protein [Aquabacterium sp.]
MIVLKNVSLLRGVKPVLEQASATLHPGEKVGLIGRNGAGKSSLFSLLAGRLAPDAGDVEIPPSWLQPGGMAEVAQNMPETDEPATEFVLQGDGRLMKARQDLIDAEAADDGHAMAEAHMALAEAGQFDAQARAQALLLGLGFKLEQTQAPVNSFSGGWRMRLQLARALMCPAKLLLLDEPTNHLDLDALVWLESWLQRYEGTLVVISHDREFLDAITKVTLHLEDGKLTRYTGGYSAFEAMRAERLSQQQAAFAKQQDKIAHLSKFIARFKAKASKAKQAQSRVKALERMEKIAPVLTASDFQFSFPEPDCLPNPMMALKDLACGYHLANDETLTIVSGINRSVLPGQRIGILGANGQGKSTVVKTLAHMNRPISGEITEGKGLSIGYFAQQELDVLRPDEGPLQHMIRLARDVGPQAREQELRDFLGRFQFTGDMVNQAVGQFSGGEKARLVLALVVWQRPNLLLLDEPTNHLDLTTREALSMALNEFEGTVMLVSHDRALLREVCDEFWLVAKGELSTFDGDLDDYQRWLQDQAREVAQAAKAARDAERAVPARGATAQSQPEVAPISSREDRKAQAQARQKLAEQAKPLKAELKKVDERLSKAHAEQAALTESLASPGLSAADRAEQGKRLKSLAEEVEALESRWLELTEEIEQLGA